MELRKVVLRFLDGTVRPGYAPLFEEGLETVYASDLSGFPMAFPIGELKAVFFVRTFSGNPAYDQKDSPGSPVHSSENIIKLHFTDGERMRGDIGPGTDLTRAFYITVLDPDDNNVMIYVNPGALAVPPVRQGQATVDNPTEG